MNSIQSNEEYYAELESCLSTKNLREEKKFIKRIYNKRNKLSETVFQFFKYSVSGFFVISPLLKSYILLYLKRAPLRYQSLYSDYKAGNLTFSIEPLSRDKFYDIIINFSPKNQERLIRVIDTTSNIQDDLIFALRNHDKTKFEDVLEDWKCKYTFDYTFLSYCLRQISMFDVFLMIEDRFLSSLSSDMFDEVQIVQDYRELINDSMTGGEERNVALNVINGDANWFHQIITNQEVSLDDLYKFKAKLYKELDCILRAIESLERIDPLDKREMELLAPYMATKEIKEDLEEYRKTVKVVANEAEEYEDKQEPSEEDGRLTLEQYSSLKPFENEDEYFQYTIVDSLFMSDNVQSYNKTVELIDFLISHGAFPDNGTDFATIFNTLVFRFTGRLSPSLRIEDIKPIYFKLKVSYLCYFIKKIVRLSNGSAEGNAPKGTWPKVKKFFKYDGYDKKLNLSKLAKPNNDEKESVSEDFRNELDLIINSK